MGRNGILIIFVFIISASVIPVISSGEPEEENVNHPPVAIISQPVFQEVFTTRDLIAFNASLSYDPDDDNLTFKWIAADRALLNENICFEINAYELGDGVEVITLYVSDGEFTITNTTSFYIELHQDDVDTDEDGIPDGTDLDDDNDGLTDVEEIEMGTNPRVKDTDNDGISDLLDEEPLNPTHPPHPREEETSVELWLFTILSFIFLLSLSILRNRPR